MNVAAALIDGGWSPTDHSWQAVVLVAATIVGLVLVTAGFIRSRCP